MRKLVFETKSENAKKPAKMIFVTGSTGRLGRALIRALLNKGYSVRALAEEKSMLVDMPSGIVPYVGRLDDLELLKEACKGADVAIHLAAIVSEYKAGLKELMDVNVQGTANVAEACASEGVEQLIFASTVDVYGSQTSGVLTEETPPKPKDKYGYSKALAEKEIEKYRDRLHYTIFRMASIYGIGFEASYFKILRALKEGKLAFIGNGENHFSLVNISDVVNAFLLAIGNTASYEKIYNISDGVPHTQRKIIEIAAEYLHVPVPKRHVNPIVARLAARSRGIDSDELRFILSNRIVNIDRARKDLGYIPAVSIKPGVEELVKAFMKKHPSA